MKDLTAHKRCETRFIRATKQEAAAGVLTVFPNTVKNRQIGFPESDSGDQVFYAGNISA